MLTRTVYLGTRTPPHLTALAGLCGRCGTQSQFVEKAKKPTYLGYDQQQLTEIILGCSMNCDSGMDLMARAAGSLDERSWTHSPSVRMDVSVPFHSKYGFRLSRGWT